MKIILQGEPVPQGRMKHFRRGGFTGLYDPNDKQKKVIREQISLDVRQSYMGLVPLNHPHISFVFHMPIPKSTPKKHLEVYESGFLKHEKKPDVDNLVKLYLDCLDGLCFEGDQKVTLGPCVKLYHTEPKTIIILSESHQILSHQEIDQLTLTYLFGEECGKSTCEQMKSLPDFYTPNYLSALQSADMNDLGQKDYTSNLKQAVRMHLLPTHQAFDQISHPCL